MNFNSPGALFWKTEGINEYRWPDGPVYHEGEHNVDKVVKYVGDTTVRDCGCGYGRLATKFDPDKYTGYDIHSGAIVKAKQMFPTYKFNIWDSSVLPFAETTIFINGPWCVDDDNIEGVIETLCTNTSALVIGEPMDPILRKEIHDHNIYPRSLQSYNDMILKCGFRQTGWSVSTYKRLQWPYTIARWERNE